MRENAKIKQYDNIKESNIQKDLQMKKLRSEKDQLYDYLGQYIDHEDTDKLINDFKRQNDEQELKITQFHLIIDLLYQARASFTNLPESVVKIWCILRSDLEVIIFLSFQQHYVQF